MSYLSPRMAKRWSAWSPETMWRSWDLYTLLEKGRLIQLFSEARQFLKSHIHLPVRVHFRGQTYWAPGFSRAKRYNFEEYLVWVLLGQTNMEKDYLGSVGGPQDRGEWESPLPIGSYVWNFGPHLGRVGRCDLVGGDVALPPDLEGSKDSCHSQRSLSVSLEAWAVSSQLCLLLCFNSILMGSSPLKL